MRPRPIVRRGTAALGALLCLGVSHTTASSSTIVELPGDTLSAVTADLDDDGAPEIVRLVDGERGTIMLEAWAAPGGRWRPVDAVALGPALAADDRRPALLVWERTGVTSVLLIEPRTMRATTREPCCLGIAEVQLVEARLMVTAFAAPAVDLSDTVQTVDLEADGTDELVLVEFVGSDPLLDPQQHVEVLRLREGAWESAWASSEPVTTLGVATGDGDGLPGEELYLGPDADGVLRRVAATGDDLVQESTSVPLRSAPWAEVVGILDESVLLRAPDDLVALAWRHGEPGSAIARARPRGLGAVAVVGSGSASRVIASRGYQTSGQGSVALFDHRLQAAGRVAEASAAGLVWDLVLAHAAPLFSLDRSIFPYVGPVPLTPGGPSGFLANGVLARPGPDGVEIGPASPLLGWAPVGVAGPDGAWMALRDPPARPDAADLAPAAEPGARLIVIPAVDVLEKPDADLGTMLRFRGAVREPAQADRSTVRAAADGFDVDVAAPAGSLVAVVGQRFDSHAVTDDVWRLRVEPPPRVPTAADGAPEGDRPFRRWVLVILPNGVAAAERWDGVFVAGPPALEVAVWPHDLGDGVVIAGRTEAGTRLRIDGSDLVVDPDGSFATTTETGLLPRVVPIEVVDEFGGVSRRTVTLPGLVDPAGIPWVGIVLIGTLGAAALMYLRVPRMRPARPGMEDDARLEEIDEA